MPESTGRQGMLQLARDYGRASGGALLFSVPLLMTMEMWQAGFATGSFRLALFVALSLPVLFGLSYYSGFQQTRNRWEDLAGAVIAFGIGFVVCSAVLVVFGLVTWDMPAGEIVGKIAVQSVPASIGAMLARRQLQGAGDDEADSNEEREERATYGGELFLMMAGALFFAFNVAPTEEMVLIAYTMTPWHALSLAILSVLVLHAFVYTVGFGGQETRPEGKGFVATFLHFTIAGYGIALIVGFYVLWTFGRFTGVSVFEIAMMVVVLAFPASIGAATARLIV